MDQVIEPSIVVDDDAIYPALAWDGGLTRMMIKPDAVRELSGDADRLLDADATRTIEHP